MNAAEASAAMVWQVCRFAELTTDQLFELLQLRVDVFVVEQACAYPELDRHDRQPQTRHLLGYLDGELVAYARLLPPASRYPGSSIGRVAVAGCHRGQGLARQLMRQAMTWLQSQWPQYDIEISAQHYLQEFYQGLGFSAVSAVYLEDGIAHLDMRYRGDASVQK